MKNKKQTGHFVQPYGKKLLQMIYEPGQDLLKRFGAEYSKSFAIDRDSEKAKDRLKYDFEVVPASATFDLKITLENATDEDLQLICVGLSEFVHGFGFIGGKRSRGLGACRLEKLEIHSLRLDDKENRTERLRKYLISGEKALQVEDSEAFLNKYINDIFGNKAEAR